MRHLHRLAVVACALVLAAAQVPAQNTAVIPAPFQPQRHEAFVEIAKQGNIDCLLMGDSITDWWRSIGKAVYDTHFGSLKCANFGISGDRTQGVLWRMENGELEGYTPKLMMLMIGTNNLGGGTRPGNTPEEIAEGITAVVTKFRTKFPQARVLLLGVFPRGRTADNPARERIKEINTIIAKLDDGKSVKYMDIGAKFLEPDGSIAVEVMKDALHPTEKGYQIWADAVTATFLELLTGKK
jgi:lysophospholipase L1-like esterase